MVLAGDLVPAGTVLVTPVLELLNPPMDRPLQAIPGERRAYVLGPHPDHVHLDATVDKGPDLRPQLLPGPGQVLQALQLLKRTVGLETRATTLASLQHRRTRAPTHSAHSNAHTQMCTPTHACTRPHTYTHTHTHTHTITLTHTPTHTQAYIYIYVLVCCFFGLSEI